MLFRNLSQMALASMPSCFALSSSISNASASSPAAASSARAAAGGLTLQVRPLTAHFPTPRILASVRCTPTVKAGAPADFSCGWGASRDSGLLGRRVVFGLIGAEAASQRLSGFRKETFAAASVKEKSIHDFIVKDISGKDVDLSIFKGKVLLVVNVASQCGLTTGNYTELTQLHKKYRDQGFEILAFPCNQFGGQEPGNNEQIKEFACSRYKAEFPVFDKVDVNGPNTSPVYTFLKASKGGILGDNIKWNFGKFLVDKNGQVVERYAPTTSPLQLESDIKKLLNA
ncbi:hypothetical protein O6H91_03G082500 [Diphasiastrum complanatum]|uniref:Uncharacterized protein n=2 Tax=Diphasiastrum complanatum TaxID=34168 RepID=A0ACC2E7Y8_DIPCM|nr:hypothetical protein O6H91_03G082500 [Diphasiastrum complanatum]KAJ7562739.1 hypothetical protein O6H91_03G082500 [Diphasiastrum complanatum]